MVRNVGGKYLIGTVCPAEAASSGEGRSPNAPSLGQRWAQHGRGRRAGLGCAGLGAPGGPRGLQQRGPVGGIVMQQEEGEVGLLVQQRPAAARLPTPSAPENFFKKMTNCGFSKNDAQLRAQLGCFSATDVEV